MYLISLTQWDYVWITALLAVNFIIAYTFRRKNPSSDAFLYATTGVDKALAFIGNIGLLEIVLAGVAGAYLGLNAIYYLIVALIIHAFCQKQLNKRYLELGATDFNDYIAIRFKKKFALAVAAFNAVLLILCISLTIALSFKSLQALMGWGFINNTMGLLGLSVVFVLVGGRAAASYNKLLNSVVILLIILVGIGLAFVKLGGITPVINNLSNLAAAQNLPSSYYIQPNFNQHRLLILLAIIIGFSGFKLLSFSATPNQDAPMSVFGRIVIVVLLVLPGILAIATPSGGSTIAGKEIITVMAQLPDGQTGYVVKAVDSHANGKHGSSSPGIVPPLLNPKTNLLKPGQYNYEVSSIVSLRHYLPKQVVALSLLMLLAGFVLAIANYMIKLSKITVKNLLMPLNLIARYGKIGELWSLQVSIVSYTGVTLIGSYFIFLHYDLLFFVSSLVAFMVLPLTILIGLILLKAPSKSIK